MFILKRPQNYKSGRRYIYMRLTVDGAVKELSVKRQWEPTHWNSQIGRASGNKEDAKSGRIMARNLSATGCNNAVMITKLPCSIVYADRKY